MFVLFINDTILFLCYHIYFLYYNYCLWTITFEHLYEQQSWDFVIKLRLLRRSKLDVKKITWDFKQVTGQWPISYKWTNCVLMWNNKNPWGSNCYYSIVWSSVVARVRRLGPPGGLVVDPEVAFWGTCEMMGFDRGRKACR